MSADEQWRAKQEQAGPGRTRMALAVQPRRLNGHGTCHGGFIFALADSAFAFACNSREVGARTAAE